MSQNHLVFQDTHKELLLYTDQAHYRIPSDYPPACDLVEHGYCTWKDNNPASWRLELTSKGIGAVALIKNPNLVDRYRMEKIDENLVRFFNDNDIIGFCVRQRDDRWAVYDDRCSRIDEETYASPGAALLGFKMFDAKLDMYMAELNIQDMHTGL